MNKLIQTTGNLLTAVLITACFHSPVHARVVINEIFYHAPNDFDDLEWVEIYNPDNQATDLTGWKLTDGVEFNFPINATI